MTRSSELLELPGVVSSGLFSRKGLMEEYEGELTEDEAVGLVNLCAALTLTMEMQGRLLSRLTGRPGWNSCYGWVTWGPEMSIVAIHDSVCLAQSAATSFSQLIQTMTESADVEVFKPGGKGEPNADIE